MIKEDKIEQLLDEISELEKLVKTIKLDDDLSIRTLSECGNITFSILEHIKQLEAEKIRIMSVRMAEQQEELMRLTALFEKYQTSAEMYKEHIAAPVPKVETIQENEVEVVESEPEKQESVETTEKTEEVVVAAETCPEEKVEVEEKATEIVEETIDTPVVKEEEKAEETAVPEVHETAAPVIPTVIEERSQPLSLNDIIEKRQLSDFRKAFSLNDRFRFRRELFGNSDEKMNEAIDCLNNKQSYEDSLNYIISELHWNMEDETVADFVKLLERRFV